MAVPGRSPVFTFESSVHPSRVLCSLEEQRQRDVLCDVTVVTAEGQSFRAHRSVLASCSEYFSQRISFLSGQNAVITLPLEVTSAGFEPLLKFAYTSKLLFCKEDVFDIQTSVSALGFKDLDGACFDFLLPKFFPSTKACAVRKTCCKKKCKKGLSKDVSDSDEVLLDDKEVKPVADSPFHEEVASQCDKSDAIQNLSIVCPATPVTPVREIANNGKVTQCPKYRKFQMACGKETDKTQPKPVIKYYCNSPCSSNSESGSCPLRFSRQVEDLFDSKSGDSHLGDANKNDILSEKKQEIELQVNSDPTGNFKETNKDNGKWPTRLVSPEYTQDIIESIGSLGQDRVAGNMEENNTFNMAQRGCSKADSLEESWQQNYIKPCNGNWTSDEANKTNACPDWLNAQLSSLHQDLDQSTSGWKCPKSEYEGASQSGLSSINSGEDSDTEETDVYCEAYAQERARQVQLPFPVDQIVEMNRNDFQELLDKQKLTREQLELVRDMRRRSKNRLAAKRCRKRKLDCIYNLQCEINKLKTEREMLIQERSRLSQLRLKTCHSVSVLCQRVCSSANLPPEQLQQLAKYTSGECPLASYVPFIDSLLSSQHQQSTQLVPSGGEDSVRCSNTVTAQEPKHNGSSLE